MTQASLDFFERFRDNLEKLPQQVALQHIAHEGKQSFSYHRVGQEVSKIGYFLESQGIGPGNTVGILMENHPRWGIAFLAAQSAGARIVPFDILHETKTLAELIQHAGCKFLISSEKFSPQLDQIQALLPESLPALINGQPVGNYFHWDTVIEQGKAASFPRIGGDLDEPFVIIYTSGTTGNPKGVVLTRRNIYRNMVELIKLIRLTQEDHILSVLPLYHILALMANFIIPLYEGARVTYLDSLDAQIILKSFQDEGISIFVCVPQFYYLVHRRILQEVERQPLIKRFLFRRLLRFSHFCNENLGWNPGKLLFSTVHERFGSQFRFFAVGGARFDREIAQSLRDLGFTMVQAYGMTETAALTTVTPFNTKAVGSVGLPLPQVQVRIDQPDVNGVGEVLIHGENIMKGYWKNPQATGEVLKNGWLHSGDLGYLNREGYLYITGRIKEVIVLSSGNNIFPEELEHFYESNCPYIKEMCILGIPDHSSSGDQEKLHAVVVPDFDYMRSQQTVNTYDIIRYMLETLSQRLPSYKHVRSFEIRREPLPRTTTRKIKRFQVEQELGKESSTATPSLFGEDTKARTATEKKVFRIIREMKTTAEIHRKMNLELDLGFDSLERVEFLSTVQEAFQIQISDDSAAQIFTVEELVTAVEKRLAGEIGEGKGARLSWSEILQEPLQPQDREKVQQILKPNPAAEFAFYLTAKLTHLLTKALFRLKVKGRNCLPGEYPYLICPNHLSFLDAFVLVGPLPYRIIKRIFFLGYADYFSGGVISFLGRLIKVVPVDADRHLRQALRLGAEGLQKGLILCVFPEGERSIDGKLKPFRKGPAILAKEMGVPVVPVAIGGTYEAWPRGVDKIRLHPVTVRFGEPLHPLPCEESYDSFSDRLFQAVDQLIKRGVRA
ncbi:AMP-binding protein [Acidobacteria bacterium AH-259-O06]|nr:AMP-binding protein [Acidobacteria bacterium AH-259-O06]